MCRDWVHAAFSLKSLGATAPGRMKWKERYAAQLRVNFSEVYAQYGMCDPRWSPEFSIADHMRPCGYDVSHESLQYCIRSLRYRGVKKVGMTPLDDVLSQMNLNTSAGFGFTDTVAHKTGLVLSYDDDAMAGYQKWYESLPDGIFPLDTVIDKLNPSYITAVKVKEEVSKIEKITEENYRTFFCVPFDQIVRSKREQNEFNEELTRCGFLFKGDDPRSSIRTLCYDCLDGDYVAFQGDAKKLDRSISRRLIERCYEIRSAFGATGSPGMQYASTHPVVSFTGKDGRLYLAKFERPQTSGRDSTTEDDLLVIYLIVCEVLSAYKIPFRDVWFTGVGDDWTLLLPKKWSFLEEQIYAEFPKHGITMKAWRVKTHEDFHFLGAEMVDTSNGFQPVWDLDRSVVRLTYRSKKESNFVYVMRIAGVYAYNVFHPKAKYLFDYLMWYVSTHRLEPSERMIVLDSVRSARDYYWLLQNCSGGPNLDYERMAKAKGSTKMARGKRSNPKPKLKSAQKSKAKRIVPSWYSAVMDPWNHEPTGIPDEFTQPSIKYETRFSNLYNTLDYATVPTHSHGLLLAVGPYIAIGGGVTGCNPIAARGYDSSTQSFSGDVSTYPFPNTAAMFPSVLIGASSSTQGYQYRISAMSAKLTYLGMEVSRAGKIMAGLMTPLDLSNAVQASSLPVNPLTMCFGTALTGGATQVFSSVRNKLRRISTVRNPDGSVEVKWIPTGVPRYCPIVQSTAAQINDYTDLGPCIIFAIEGDMTGPIGSSGATVAGNQWQLDVVAHVEVIPLSRFALAVGPSPSPYDPQALSYCLNKFETTRAVSEWEGGVQHTCDDGAQSTSGGAWEILGNIGGAFYKGGANALDAAGYVLGHPATRLITANMARRRMTRYQAITVD